jgi:hypothetical protein
METNGKHKCTRCGKLKNIEDLNGYDPITNDYSEAYCSNLMGCDSKEKRNCLISVYLEENKLPMNGYALIIDGVPFGWTADIEKHDSSKVKPGAKAIDVLFPDNTWTATDGDDESGAKYWSADLM